MGNCCSDDDKVAKAAKSRVLRPVTQYDFEESVLYSEVSPVEFKSMAPKDDFVDSLKDFPFTSSVKDHGLGVKLRENHNKKPERFMAEKQQIDTGSKRIEREEMDIFDDRYLALDHGNESAEMKVEVVKSKPKGRCEEQPNVITGSSSPDEVDRQRLVRYGAGTINQSYLSLPQYADGAP